MFKRLANKIIDLLIPSLLDEFLKLRFDVFRVSENAFEITIYYDGMKVFKKTIKLSIQNR